MFPPYDMHVLIHVSAANLIDLAVFRSALHNRCMFYFNSPSDGQEQTTAGTSQTEQEKQNQVDQPDHTAGREELQLPCDKEPHLTR